MHSAGELYKIIEKELSAIKLESQPSQLYEPIRYMINIGGKRLRPVMMLMSNELFSEIDESTIKAACAIEVFHNFTLLHDDIMDKAPLRRSKETVHKKWNPDIAILSGDTMFVLSCQLLMNVPDKFLRTVMDIFYKTAVEVCEGQQSDMDFETQSSVSIDNYLEMIGKKTAALIACSMQLGAVCGGSSPADSSLMYDFGRNLGLAFQLHDDILDVYGDSDKFGKQVGGDILSNKKTFLLLTALENSDAVSRKKLTELISTTSLSPEDKIEEVKSIYEKSDARKHATEKMEEYFKKAMSLLAKVNVSHAKKEMLFSLAESIMVREK